ncbi:MAG: putative DNA modification/repair radical SAM protein [Clostridiales bacterium]|jgi:putative DNA modification/repair radical SAM protein|nr:putative DNA modification/repair radical SAM protein [Clostridiales bacterium]
MELMERLKILTGAAKYDVACTSSGVGRAGARGGMGNAAAAGICHSFATDGRCISLLKLLMSNYCVYDCKYCANRSSNDVPRASLTPEELADLTIAFYRRNYIEGLFLSSGVVGTPDNTMERMLRVLDLLRRVHRFNGYIHVKAIPGCSDALVSRLGLLADRMSVNIELPSEKSLNLLAPNKGRDAVIRPMGYIRDRLAQSGSELALFRGAPRFVPAGQSTQMIIGATPDSDFQILRLSESLYRKFRLKRVFYSAYIPIGSHALLPVGQPPPLLREHRLYQSDWLMRFYGFAASELLSETRSSLNLAIDPKCNWALGHLDRFPVEVNRAEYEILLRVPGIGVNSARRIVAARRTARLDFAALKKLGVVLKRAVYFITCSGKYMYGLRFDEKTICRNLTAGSRLEALSLAGGPPPTQLSFLPTGNVGITDAALAAAVGGMDSARAAASGITGAAFVPAALPTFEDDRMSVTGQL